MRAGRMSRSRTLAGSASPSSWPMTSSNRSAPPSDEPRPCHAGRKRPSARGSTGSTSRRSLASERRRSIRRTSGSHHSRSTPPGRNSPRTSTPAAIRCSRPVSTTPRGSPQRAAGSRRQEGPMPARIARQQTAQRIAGRRQERLRHSPWWRHADGVPVARRVLGGDPARLPGDPHLDRAPVGGQRPQPLPCGATPRRRIDAPHPVGHLFRARSPRPRSRSWTWSAEPAARSRVSAWSSSSSSTRASASSSSRSSSAPRSSRSRSRSSASACARRSTRGASPSYM